MHEQSLSLRALKTGVFAALLFFVFLFAGGRSAWAWGFAIGALLSLCSLLSLSVVVRFLMRPGAPRHTRALLLLTFFMKLPLYMAGLYLLTRLPGVTPGASVYGIGLIPAIITLKAIGEAVVSSRTEQTSQPETLTLSAPAMPALPETESHSMRTARPTTVGPMYEGG